MILLVGISVYYLEGMCNPCNSKVLIFNLDELGLKRNKNISAKMYLQILLPNYYNYLTFPCITNLFSTYSPNLNLHREISKHPP